MDAENIQNLIEEYLMNYDIDLEQDDIREFVYQNEKAYEDAVEYFVKILESCQP